jgi:hypothetical protein
VGTYAPAVLLTVLAQEDVVDYAKDPRVDAYFEPLPAWQQAVCQRLRDIAHAVHPDVQETIKRTVQPYFLLDGNVCALLATKDHVNLFVYDGGIVDDPRGLVTGGQENATARTIAFREGDPVDEPALLEFLRQVVANNQAGGWRKLKAEHATKGIS